MRQRLTTVLDLVGVAAVGVGIYVLAGVGGAVIVAGVAALVLSWRLSK